MLWAHGSGGQISQRFVSLMLDEIFIYNREQLTNEVGGTPVKRNS